MSTAKVIISFKNTNADFGEVTLTTEKNVKPAYEATGWFRASMDFPDFSIEIPSTQATITFYETPPKGVVGLYIALDKVSESIPAQFIISFYNNKPSTQNTLAALTTERPKIEGPLEKCPKFFALGFAVWQ